MRTQRTLGVHGQDRAVRRQRGPVGRASPERPSPFGEGGVTESGGIKSADRCVCHVRLKRSEARWYLADANQILALRCAKYNGTCNRVFEAHRQKVKQGHLKAPHKKLVMYPARLSNTLRSDSPSRDEKARERTIRESRGP